MKQANGQQINHLGIHQWVSYSLAFIATGAGVTYFLGRLYLDSYYGFFGVARGALSFSQQDYMFSCLPVFMMLIGLIPTTFWTYTSFMNWKPFGIDTTIPWKKRWMDVFYILAFTSIFAHNIYTLFIKRSPVNIPSLCGLPAGVSIGWLIMPTAWILQLWFGEHGLKRTTDRHIGIFHIVWMLVVFSALLPIFSGKLAEQAALADLERLPQVTIACHQLPEDLQSSATEDERLIDAKLLTINNNWAYILTSTTDKQETEDVQYPGSKKVYSIRTSDIKYIIYYCCNE